MKNIVLFKTDNANFYLYNLKQKQFYIINGIVYSLLRENEKGKDIFSLEYEAFKNTSGIIFDENEFAKAKIKAKYYIENIIVSNDEINLTHFCTADDLKYQLANNPNICFEITENCNLKCTYCAYSDFYKGFDRRTRQNMKFINAKAVIDFVYGFCKTNCHISYKKNINISFYGGEPLLLIGVIQQILDYTKSLCNDNINFTYSMTTNGMLLDRYMDILYENKFELLISLDGDKEHNAYRVTQGGIESHSKVFENVISIKNTYPEYYKEFVEFNCVIHNLSDLNSISDFYKKHLDKQPQFSRLAFNNLNSTKRKEFYDIFQKDNNKSISSEVQINESDATIFINKLTKFMTKDYSTLYNSQTIVGKYTGTCVPFFKKIFVTAKGRILPCENVNHNYSFGTVRNGKVSLSLEKTSEYYNKFIADTTEKCKGCYRIYDCDECAFNIDENKNSCFSNKLKFERHLSMYMTYLEENPENLQKILNDGTVLQ